MASLLRFVTIECHLRLPILVASSDFRFIFLELWINDDKCFVDLLSLHQLDDGWPESVEEQVLLLLVWRHHIIKLTIY